MLGLGLGLTSAAVRAALRASATNSFAVVSSGALASGATFARTGAATYQNASGVLSTAADGVARLDYTSAGTLLGLLIEGARENLITQANALDGAPWSSVRLSSVTANAATGPDGTTNAERLIEDATAANTHTRRVNFAGTLTNGATYSMSFFQKAGTRGFGGCTEASAVTAQSIIDLSTGAVTSTTGTGSPASFVRGFGNSWWRHGMRFTAASTTGNAQCCICATGTSLSYSGDGVSYIDAVGGQMELGAFPSSFIPTTGGAATRNAETATIPTSSITTWDATEGSIVFSGSTAPGMSGTQVLWQADDGTANERLTLYRDASGNIKFDVVDGGVTQASLTLGAVTAGLTAFKAAVAWSANDIAGSLNGAAVVTDASATLPTVTTVRIGHDETGNHSFGWALNMTHYGQRLANGALIAAAT